MLGFIAIIIFSLFFFVRSRIKSITLNFEMLCAHCTDSFYLFLLKWQTIAYIIQDKLYTLQMTISISRYNARKCFNFLICFILSICNDSLCPLYMFTSTKRSECVITIGKQIAIGYRLHVYTYFVWFLAKARIVFHL